jgi:HEAT repeat protein/ATP/ADP translocase
MTATIIDSDMTNNSLRQRLTLLVGQGISLGLMLAFVVITGMTLMLDSYGSDAVPYVYIMVAVLGSLLFYGFGEIQRRVVLPRLSLGSLVLTTLFLFLTWAGLVLAEWQWLAFVVLASFSLLIQVGFVVIGAQAGRLLDVREIKRYFPWIVSGFVFGFIIGGALAPLVTSLNGRPADMLLAGTAVALLFCTLIFIINRQYGAVLSSGSARANEPKQKTPSMRSLLTHRTVLLLFLYQMLSAMASQILDFMVLAVADARFTDGPALAEFFGQYTVFLNLTDLLFVLLLAGILLSRFGLRFGLMANPAVVIALLVAIVVTGIIGGPTGTLFFWLVIITRISDLTVTDGTTRTSINAAYQALQPNERAAVQTAVEGIGVPIALGLVGLILLLFQAFASLTLVHIAAFTLLISFGWLAAGALVYKEYTVGLLQTMRRRVLAPTELSLDDASTFAAVEQLLHKDQLSDVRLGLDMLSGVNHLTLDAHLLRLAEQAPQEIRVEALRRIAERQLSVAQPIVHSLLDNESESVRSAALYAFCALEGESSVERLTPYLTDPSASIQEAALVGLLRFGGISGVVAAAKQMMVLQAANTVADKSLVARVIAAVESDHFYQPLIPLLQDNDATVRQAALRAATRVPNPRLIPLLVDNLANSATRSAATEALIATGENILPVLATALDGSASFAPAVRHHLVRIGGHLTGKNVWELFLQHLDHPEPELRGAILRAALNSNLHLQAETHPQLQTALRQEAYDALALVAVREEMGDDDGLLPLKRALEDAFYLGQQRVLLLLRLTYDNRAMTRVADLLSQARGSEQALALELLDVSLSPEHRALVLPIINPQQTTQQRLEQLRRMADIQPANQIDRLRELALDPENYWRQAWLRACAAYAIGSLGYDTLAGALKQLLEDSDPVVRETAVWALNKLPQPSNQLS